jgi:aminopeptidase N
MVVSSRHLRKALPSVFFVLTLFGTLQGGFPSPAGVPSSLAPTFSPNFSYDIQSHRLSVHIDPSQHIIKGKDQLEIQARGKRPQISILLNSRMKVGEIVGVRTGQPLPWAETSFSDTVKRVDISLPSSSYSFSISYEGLIYDSIERERNLQFVRGDKTSGLVGTEGVYLSSSSHWYPDRPDSISLFETEVTIPAPFRVVTQGELVSEEWKGGLWKTRWISRLPAESLTLVAGKYSVKTRTADGVKISTYFFPDDDRFSDIFLSAAEDYLRTYADLLGPFPFRKFDIVQNFFSSGYSLPTFTLLAPEAIRQGKEFLRPGALDHEIVHSWWGHAVMAKPGTGNWMEALTAYCTNYYYRELRLGEESARKYRQDILEKYAIQVPHFKDYSLRQFEGKRDESDGQIGYGKGSLVFHMLRRLVGKELFFSTLREFAVQYGGKQATWKDIQKTFEETSGKPLDEFFSQWLDVPGGPHLKLEGVKSQATSKGYLVSAEIVQEGEVFQLSVPVEVDDGVWKKTLLVEVSKKRTPFSIEVQKTPLSLVVDPNAHLFRRLYPEEGVPCLNALLEDRDKILVLPEKGDEESRKIYLELAQMIQKAKGGRILFEKELKDDDVRNASLMLLGDSWRGSHVSRLISGLPPAFRLRDGKLQAEGNTVNEGDESLLLTFAHPVRAGKWVTLYYGVAAPGLSRAQYIFYYGWDSYLLFKKGRPAKRGNLPPLRSFCSYDFLSREHLDVVQTQRLARHVAALTSQDLGGRFPGTTGYRKAQAYLARQLEEMGIVPIHQPFSITVRDIGRSDLLLRTPAGEESLKAVPLRFSKEGGWKGPYLWFDDKRVEELRALPEKTALVFQFDVPKKGAYASLLKRIKELQSRKPSALIVFVKESELDALAPYITYPSYFPPNLEARIKQREKEGQYLPRLTEASKVAARARDADPSVELPVVIVPYSNGQAELVQRTFDRNDSSFELAVHFNETRLSDSNIGAIIEGSDPEKKGEFLVVGAHYDHLGKDETTGILYQGADDNASGVAALLEIARSLFERRKELKRSVVVLFFGGEEWGLWGARAFLKNPFVPAGQIKAMLSLDSIGGAATEREVFLIGGSTYPALAQASRRFVQRLGLREGRDIDPYAFDYGSDHYPFHQKGIPSLDYYASDQKRMHTLRDTYESIDFEKVQQVGHLVYLTAYQLLTEP